MSRVIRFHRFGPADVLQYETATPPAPGPGEVLVRVQAIGVSWKDVLWRQNLAPEQANLPAGVGDEMAGVVEALGAGVEDLQVGMAVASFPANTPNRYPAYGEHVVMPRNALTPYPDALTPAQACVHYAPLLLAYFALVDLAGLKAGQRVLITEASNCFAPQTVQLAKALGAQVIASTQDATAKEFLKQMGADQVVVTEEQDLVLAVEKYTDKRGVEVVLDACGGQQMSLLGDVAAPRGKLVLYGLNGGNEASFPACAAFKKHLQFYRHCLLDFTGHPEMGIECNPQAVERALVHINQLTRDGLLKPPIDKVFPFEDVVEAHRYMESGPKRGRVLLQLAEIG
ncbi:zinc-dependent alcohol dehydrogenase family protein [Pseudomonas mangiferae]|uniref:Zinc-dependent alcohol dehydrogenase family protein n=1 Tax=Pseudomonas mangiferae TaxID=2593654 RepID=A0A553GVK4_9PSED|nr:zinc-dependent alcohol dehydrogenase family protein [Pseudomonas mangiferae]TRX73531.1 zinc-dependent alcohol dehydrogenase family protein [Pseudomonas mangiferae]